MCCKWAHLEYEFDLVRKMPNTRRRRSKCNWTIMAVTLARRLITMFNRNNNLPRTLPSSSSFLGPRGPLGLPSFVCSSVGAKNLDQLYSSINHHRTTANLSDIVLCMSGAAEALMLLMH